MPGHRAETTVHIGGRTFILRPTFAQLEKLESTLGLGLFQIMDGMARDEGRSLALGTIVRILHAGCVGGMQSAAPSLEEFGDLCLAEGLGNCCGLMAEFLQTAVLTEDQRKRLDEIVEEQKQSGNETSPTSES